MAFIPKQTKKKDVSVHRSLYIKESLMEEVEKIAIDNNTSINNVIISMIEFCIKDSKKH